MYFKGVKDTNMYFSCVRPIGRHGILNGVLQLYKGERNYWNYFRLLISGPCLRKGKFELFVFKQKDARLKDRIVLPTPGAKRCR